MEDTTFNVEQELIKKLEQIALEFCMTQISCTSCNFNSMCPLNKN
jgi:hypothetical protein